MTTRPKRIWRRRLIRGVICLLLGAVTTVGVAWGLAATTDGPYPHYVGVESTTWPLPVPEGWPRRPENVVAAEAFGLTYADAHHGDLTELPQHWQSVRLFGCPLPSMGVARSTTFDGQGAFPDRSIQPRDGISVHASTRVLPLQPIFPGFLLDTLFYAAPWWLILITPGWGGGAIRRFRRRRGGRCIQCGYDLAGLHGEAKATPVCPECGPRGEGAL